MWKLKNTYTHNSTDLSMVAIISVMVLGSIEITIPVHVMNRSGDSMIFSIRSINVMVMLRLPDNTRS